MINNCFFWAHWRFIQLRREWRRRGKPINRVPSINARPSRSRPDEVLHWIVGWWCYESMTLQDAQSFVPLHPRDVPIWLAWTRISFFGRVKSGDNPSLPPENEP